MNPKDGTISAAEYKDCRHPKASCIADKLAGDGINLKELKGCIEGAIGAKIMRSDDGVVEMRRRRFRRRRRGRGAGGSRPSPSLPNPGSNAGANGGRRRPSRRRRHG